MADGLHTAVIGAGTWGTALSAVLAGNGHLVKLWALEPEVVISINTRRENSLFLPGAALPEGISASNDLAAVLSGAALVVVVVPSQFFRSVLAEAAPFIEPDAVIVSCTKGIEENTGFTMCELAGDILSGGLYRRMCALSGPSFAKEVVAQAPTAVTIASRDNQAAKFAQSAFSNPRFRAYTSADLVGVEIGGAVKNPLAIAAGMCHGLELGHNALAGLLTRGLAEMSRLCRAMGGRQETMSGLSGAGDLMLTCYGPLSRNRGVGVKLAEGMKIKEITTSMRMVAEGVRNTRTTLELAKKLDIEMPIVSAVEQVIYQDVDTRHALESLMGRALRSEY